MSKTFPKGKLDAIHDEEFKSDLQITDRQIKKLLCDLDKSPSKVQTSGVDTARVNL